MNNQMLIEEIHKKSICKKLVFFVGAGVSKLSGYPTWRTLVINMANEVGYKYMIDDYAKPLLSSDEFLKIPQMYFDNLGKDKYLETVKNQFKESCIPNIVHDKLMELNPNHFITTNYDNLLEQASTKYGKNYSVINSDAKVSSCESNKYLLKVHGDFEKGKFVLKEDDYIQYSDNYKLIDNVMKTVMSTNLIVFIGYGLNDYNIKIILNWVKQVQGKTFIEPIFIYTDEYKLSDKEIKYYKNKGIRIIDSNEYGGIDYIDRYKDVLNRIVDFNISNTDKDKDYQLDILFNKIACASKLQYLRKSDIKELFDNNYSIDMSYISNYKKQAKYLEEYYKEANYYKSNRESEKKYNQIKLFFDKYHIIGMKDDQKEEKYRNYQLQINEKFFEGYYTQMEEYTKKEYKGIKANYRKSYYLYIIGDLKASYELYTKLLYETKERQNWLYYYLCQINRNYVYQTINYLSSNNGKMIMTINFGQQIGLFTDDFLDRVHREMKNFKIEDLFNELPFQFQKEYSFLNKINTNYYKIESENLLKSKVDIEQSIANNSIPIGTPSFQEVIVKLYDITKFTYENLLLLSCFSEHKNFVSVSYIMYFQGIFNEINSNRNLFGMPFETLKDFQLDYYDFIMMTKNMKMKDIEQLTRIYDFNQLKYKEEKKIVAYIDRVILFHVENFSNEIVDDRFLSYIIIKDELLNIILLSGYFIKNINSINKILDFMLNVLNDRELNVSYKYSWSWKLLHNKKSNRITIGIIEKFIMNRLYLYSKNPSERELAVNGRFTGDFRYLIEYINKKYVSDTLSEYCKSLKSINENVINQIINLIPILSEEAKKNVLSFYEINNINRLKKLYELDVVEDLSEYVPLINEHLEKEQNQFNEDRKKGIYKPDIYSSLNIIGFWIESGLLGDKVGFKKYIGFNDKFDFWVDFESFIKEKFNLDWLLNYNLPAIKSLAQNLKRKEFVIQKLEKELQNPNSNHKYASKYFEIYKLLNE